MRLQWSITHCLNLSTPHAYRIPIQLKNHAPPCCGDDSGPHRYSPTARLPARSSPAIAVLGRLIRGGWHDLWLTIEAFQSNYGQEIGLVSKGQ